MKQIFRKIATIAASALMIGSTAGFALAANYPAPFVQSGAANVAVVYGANAALSDVVGAANIGSNLATALAAQTASGSTVTAATVSGEAVSLATGSTKIWLNTSLSAARTTLTKSDLPTILGENTFSGNVDSKMTSSLTIGTNKVTLAKQPTSSSDPVIGVTLNTNSNAVLYNATVTFPAINFSHADSEGEVVRLFGRDFVVSTATDATSLVLFSSAESVSLVVGGSNPNPKTTVTIGGVEHTVELITGSGTTSATIAVDGESKQITSGASKKVNGVDIAVKSVTESTAINTITADILVGSQKLTFATGTQVTSGSDDDPIDGTLVTFGGTPSALTSLTVGVYAPDSSNDAILPGASFTDPVFGSFKVDFAGLSVPAESAARDTIKIDKSGDKAMSLSFTDSDSNTKTFDFVYNATRVYLADQNGYGISLRENVALGQNNFTMIGNEDYGHLVQLTRIYNNTGSDYSNDAVTFKDVISGETYSMDATSEGGGRLTIDGRQYTVTYSGSGETGTVNLKFPTSDSSATQRIMFPTIKTKNGAKIALYEPQTLDVTGLTGILIPDGDGYTTISATHEAASGNWTFSATGVELNNTQGVFNQNVTVGDLVYNVNLTGLNSTTWTVFNPSTNLKVTTPAMILIEGKDVSSSYEAIIVDVESSSAASSSDPLGVNTVSMTSPTQYSSTLQSDSDLTLSIDYWGTEVTQDSNTASQKVVTINYPSEQVYANLFVGANAAVITGGTASGGSATELGSVTVSDAEAASVAGKNLIVIGGSCINSVAAQLLGSAACSADFTSATSIAAGEAIIKSFDRSGKVALLVAGYNAADTTKAVTYLTNKVVDTTVGKALKVTSATEATAIAAATV